MIFSNWVRRTDPGPGKVFLSIYIRYEEKQDAGEYKVSLGAIKLLCIVNL